MKSERLGVVIASVRVRTSFETTPRATRRTFWQKAPVTIVGMDENDFEDFAKQKQLLIQREEQQYVELLLGIYSNTENRWFSQQHYQLGSRVSYSEFEKQVCSCNHIGTYRPCRSGSVSIPAIQSQFHEYTATTLRPVSIYQEQVCINSCRHWASFTIWISAEWRTYHFSLLCAQWWYYKFSLFWPLMTVRQ